MRRTWEVRRTLRSGATSLRCGADYERSVAQVAGVALGAGGDPQDTG
ncbi:MAG: hypothetical protein ACPL7C_03975 [Anaerolineae bacterium]